MLVTSPRHRPGFEFGQIALVVADGVAVVAVVGDRGMCFDGVTMEERLNGDARRFR